MGKEKVMTKDQQIKALEASVNNLREANKSFAELQKEFRLKIHGSEAEKESLQSDVCIWKKRYKKAYAAYELEASKRDDAEAGLIAAIKASNYIVEIDTHIRQELTKYDD